MSVSAEAVMNLTMNVVCAVDMTGSLRFKGTPAGRIRWRVQEADLNAARTEGWIAIQTRRSTSSDETHSEWASSGQMSKFGLAHQNADDHEFVIVSIGVG